MTVAYPPFTSSTMAEPVSFRAAPSASDIDRHIATIVHEGRQFDKRKDGRAAVLALKAQAEGESVLRLMPPISSLSQTEKERVQKYRSTMQRTRTKGTERKSVSSLRQGAERTSPPRPEARRRMKRGFFYSV